MTLKRPAIADVVALLKDGSYTRAGNLAKRLSPNDALVAALADELELVGDKNKDGKRGPRFSHRVRVASVDGEPCKKKRPSTVTEVLASMTYNDLLFARDIVDGKITDSSEMSVQEAKTLLVKWKLLTTTRQLFRARLRAALAAKFGIPEAKIFP